MGCLDKYYYAGNTTDRQGSPASNIDKLDRYATDKQAKQMVQQACAGM